MNNYKFQNYYYFRNIKESVEIIEELIVNNVLPENFWKTLQDGMVQEISIQERMLAPSRGSQQQQPAAQQQQPAAQQQQPAVQQQQPAAQQQQQQPAAQQAQAGTSQQKKGIWGGIKGAISKPFQAIGKKVSGKTWGGAQGPGLFKPGGLFNPVGLGPGTTKGYGHVDVKSSGPGGQNEPYWQKFNKKHGIKSEWTGASNSLLGEAISKLYTSAKYASPEHRYELMFLIKQLQEHITINNLK